MIVVLFVLLGDDDEDGDVVGFYLGILFTVIIGDFVRDRTCVCVCVCVYLRACACACACVVLSVCNYT